MNKNNSVEILLKNTLVQVAEVKDICDLDVDVIVNAANGRLLPGAGVCGAIRNKAGDHVFTECADYLRQKGKKELFAGEAMMTGGGNLNKKIIHAVGPVWGSHPEKEKQSLYKAYYNSLSLADEHHFNSIAFPSISTGIYGFPVSLAAEQAIQAINNFVYSTPETSLKRILIALWPENFDTFKMFLLNLKA